MQTIDEAFRYVIWNTALDFPVAAFIHKDEAEIYYRTVECFNKYELREG